MPKKETKNEQGEVVPNKISKNSRKILKGFYTANQLEIDPNKKSYWTESTKANQEENIKLYEEIFNGNRNKV